MRRQAWPKMTKNANFGPNLVVFGQKILILTGESKSFGTHMTEKPPRHLVCIVFWSGMGPQLPIFDQKCQFWAKNPNFYGKSKSFGIHITENHLATLFALFFGQAWHQMGHLFRVENIARCESNWPLKTKIGYLDNWIFGAEVDYLFCQQGISLIYLGLNFPIQTNPKKISLSQLWVIFRGSPLFWAVLGLCQFISISTLNFGPFSTKLVGTVQNDPE